MEDENDKLLNNYDKNFLNTLDENFKKHADDKRKNLVLNNAFNQEKHKVAFNSLNQDNVRSGTNPFLDQFVDLNAEDPYNELRAANQSGAAQLGLGLLRAGSKAAQEISKLPGVIGGAAQATIENTQDLISGKDEHSFIDTTFNNSWIKTIDEIGEKINTDVLPVYTAKAVKEGNLWDNISSTSFWATDGADGLGFIIGMMAPGAIFEYVGLGSKLISAASQSQRLAKITSMSGKAEQAVSALKTMGVTGKTIDSGLAVMGNTLFEAGAEAKSVGDDLDRKKDEFMTRRIAEIKSNLAKTYNVNEPELIQGPVRMVRNPDGTQSMSSPGLVPNPNYKNLDQIALEQAEGEFKEQRGLAMRNTFVSNVGILLGPNAMMHKAIWGKAAQRFEKTAEQGIKGVAKRGGKMLERWGKAGASEGLWEEGSQTTVENMYVNKAMKGSLGKDGLEGFVDDFNIGDFAKEYVNTLTSVEGQKAIFLGGALGGPMMSYQGRKEDVANRKRTNEVLDGIDKQITHFNNIFDNDIYQKNEDGSFKYKKDDQGNDTTERLFDNKAVAKMAKDLNYTEQQSAMFDFAVKMGNTDVVEKLKQDAIFNLVLPSIHNGEMGIQALEQQLKENSKFQELVERDAKADNKDKTKEFVQQTLETAKYLQKQNEKFGDFSRDVIDLTHPTATQKQKDDFINKLNASYLNSKHQLRQNETKLKALEDKRQAIFDELGVDPLYDPEAEFPTAKMKTGIVSDEDLMQRAGKTKAALESNELLKKTNDEYNDLKKEIENHKKDISEIWQGKDKIAGAFNNFVTKDDKATEDTSDEKVAQADQLLTDISNTQSNKELDRLLLPAYVPQKTEADYNREAELGIVKDVSKSINEDQSIDNLKLNLDKLKSLNISSVKIDEIAKRIEDRIKQLQDEQESFKDFLLDAIDNFDSQSQKVNDFISELNTEIDSLLKTKDVLVKSLNEQDRSPKGRNAKLIKQLIKEAEDELNKVEKELEYLNGLKEEAQKELDKIEQDLSYIFNRYDQIEKSDFSSIQDIVDYLNTNKELFKEHRFDFERLLVNKYHTEQSVEGLSTAIDALENYTDVLRATIKSFLTSQGKIKNESVADHKFIKEELMKTTKALFEAKKDLKSEQAKLSRLNKSIIDKQAIKSINLEEEFWNDLQTFKKDKINPLINNPVIAAKLEDKRNEFTQQEEELAEQVAEEQIDLQEEQVINNPEEVIELVTPTVTTDENENFQSESLPTQANEDEDNEVVHAENMSEEKVDEELKGEVAGAKVISTNRETGETLYDNLQDFVDYERSPRDKSNDVVTFEVGDINPKDLDLIAALKNLKEGNLKYVEKPITSFDKEINKQIKLLEEKLPIKITITDNKGNDHISYLEAHSKANQSDPDSKQMLEQQTMPLRRNIIAEAIKNKGLDGLTTNIVKQYPGLLTVQYTDEGVAKNNIFDLQVFDGMSEDEKVLYFQKNTAFVNWEGNLVSTLNPKKLIKGNFGQNHKGEVFLNIPQNNGKPFYLKLNVSKVSEDKAEAIYEMINALSQVSQTIKSPTSFQAMTVGKFFDTLTELDSQLSDRLQQSLKNEIDFVKKYNKGSERNESLGRFLDLLIYHKSENAKTGFNLSKDGNLKLGSLAQHLTDGLGFKHALTITKDELDTEEAKNAIVNYIQYKRHNVLITKDNVEEFVFNNKDYVKYLLNSEYPILTTNAVVNQPTFQGYSNVYLNQDVKNSKVVSSIGKRGTIAPIVKDDATIKSEILGKIDAAIKLGTIDELVGGANNDVSGAKGKTYRQLYNAELVALGTDAKADIIQTNEPNIQTVGNVTFGTANKQGQTDNNEDAVYVDTQNGIFILADGMGGEGMITLSPSQASKVVINKLLGKEEKTLTDLVYEEYLKNPNISSEDVVKFLISKGFSKPNPIFITPMLTAFKTKGDLSIKKGFRSGATALKAEKINKNTYKIEKVGDTVFFVVDKNGKVIKQHGLSDVATTSGYMFSIKDGKPFSSTPKTDNFTITLNEGETLVLATDFIETDKAIQDFINSDFGKNLDFAKFQKENKTDDSTFITITYDAELVALEDNTQQAKIVPVELETANEDGTLPSVKAKLQAALGNKTTPTKKEDVKMDTTSIKSLFENATEDGKAEILFNLADNLNSLDSIDIDNLSKTFDTLIAEAQKQNKSIDEINEICGL
jgi:hypothetical protein